MLIHSCKDREVSKKVSLSKRSHVTENHIKSSDVGSLKFGFDLRLGPREDVRIYLPFMRYLEQNTGNRFSLRFTEKYEDTVENLGKGITHFAALGPVNCVLANKKIRHRLSCHGTQFGWETRVSCCYFYKDK